MFHNRGNESGDTVFTKSRRKLFGREPHVAKIMEAFERVNRGKGGVVLLPGVSGSGKTTLAEILKEPTTHRNGYFLQGKFNQYDQNVPYVAWHQSLVQFCKVVGREDEKQKEKWADSIREAVGDNGQLLIDFVPEFESLIGKQSPVATISPSEARHRFAGVIRYLLNVICRPEHPLVLFIDDWQWADAGSLHLLSDLHTGEGIGYLLLVIAYRCDEVDDSHRLKETLSIINKHRIPIETIKIDNLSSTEMRELIQNSAKVNESSLGEFSERVHFMTKGNPFFAHTLLDHCFEKNCKDGKSLESAPAITETINFQNGVVDLFSERLSYLEEEDQKLISLAACIGHRFDLETLSLISTCPLSHLQKRLKPHAPSLIVPLEENLIESTESESSVTSWYRFSHDRVQQAAYNRIPSEEMPQVRLEIGRRMLEKLTAAQMSERVCEVAEHINQGVALIESTEEKIRGITVNVAAARKAKSATAFRSALQYHRAAQVFLRDPSVAQTVWAEHHDLGMSLMQEQAETEFLEGDPEVANRCIRTAVAEANSPVEKSESLSILIVHYTLQAKYSQAISTGREALEVLGILLPEKNFEKARDAEILAIRQLLKKQTFSQIAKLPEAKDELMRTASKVLIAMGPPCYRSHQALWSVIVPKVVNITLTYGQTPQVGYSHTAFAGLLGWVTNDYSTGRQFTDVATQVMNGPLASPSDKAIFHLMLGSSARHWSKHLLHSSEDYEEAYRIGVRSGNLQYAAYAFGHNMYCRYFQGVELSRLITESKSSLAFSRTRHNQWAIDLLDGGIRLFSHLSQRNPLQSDVDTEERDYLAKVESHQNQQVKCIYTVLKANGCLILGDPQAALQLSREAEPLIHMVGTQGLLPWAEHVFTKFMSIAALDEKKTHDRRSDRLAELKELIGQLGIWAGHCTANFEHKHFLASAEMARLDHRYVEAAELYDQAIDSARDHGFLQWEGFANERASLLWRSLGKQRIEQFYWQQAFYCYDRWGAKSKLQLMAETLRKHLAQDSNKDPIGSSDAAGDTKQQLERLLNKHVDLLLRQSHEMTELKTQAEQASSIDELANAANTLRSDIVAGREASKELRRQRDLERSLNDELERRVSERTIELTKAESRFRSVLESAPIAMVLVDSTGTITLVNSALEKLFGYTKQELIHLSIENLFSPKTKAMLETPTSDCFGRLREIKSILDRSPHCKRKDDSQFPVELGLNPVTIDGELFFLSAILDITEQHKTLEAIQDAKEQAESANRAKSTFLATMSHEIRTPMNGILGTCELAMSTELTSEQRKYMETMQDSAEALLNVINDILDLSKIEAGKLEIESQAFNPNRVLSDVVQLLKPNIGDKEILMECQLDCRADGQFLGDQNRMRQVLINLVGNAIKFTDAGRISITSRQVEKEAGAVSLEVTVEDTGVGISQNNLDSIFEPFSQVDGSDHRRFGGTGLGLSISSKIVQLMGGVLVVESQLGRGSKFQFMLPLREAKQSTRETPRWENATKSNVPLRILLAEDNATNQLVARSILEKKGHHVTVATNGVEAVERFKRSHYDLILMDVQMPELDGLEATRQIRSYEKLNGGNICVIALTAGAMQSDREKCIAAGMDEYLSKPIRWKELNSHIQRLGVNKSLDLLQHEFSWDINAAVGSVGGDATLLVDALEMILDDLDTKVTQLYHASSIGDADTITHATGQLRESAQTLQLSWLERLALEMEHSSSNDDWSKLKHTVHELESKTPRLKCMLRHLAAREPAWSAKSKVDLK